jgi:hypothetical protein
MILTSFSRKEKEIGEALIIYAQNEVLFYRNRYQHIKFWHTNRLK